MTFFMHEPRQEFAPRDCVKRAELANQVSFQPCSFIQHQTSMNMTNLREGVKDVVDKSSAILYPTSGGALKL